MFINIRKVVISNSLWGPGGVNDILLNRRNS